MKIIRNNQGYTLIEIVVVLLLITVVGGVIVDLFIGQNRIYKMQTAEFNITGDARLALDDLDNYTRMAYRTAASYSTYTAGSQILILQIQSVGATNQLVAGAYDYVVYYLSSGGLYRQIFPHASSTRPATTKKLASGITSLSFVYNDPDFLLVTIVNTNLTIQEQAGSQARTITLSSQSRLRNY